jgi:hypothetical protein
MVVLIPSGPVVSVSTEEATIMMRIEEQTKTNKNYLRETLMSKGKQRSPLIITDDELDEILKAEGLTRGKPQEEPKAP